MKLAIVSDVHGNLAALDAVLADLDRLAPDRIVHGGDLVFNGPRPAECLAAIRERGWEGIVGNTDELLWARPDQPAVRWTASRLSGDDLDWLRALPMEWRQDDELALVHAAPGDVWKLVEAGASDAELRDTYGPLGAALAVYCHIHQPFVRRVGDALTVANTGSVGLPFDGDPRAAYLVITDGRPETRRVAYDIERAVSDLRQTGHPAAGTLEPAYRSAVRS